MSFFTGFGVSALVYWTLNIAFPVRSADTRTRFEEVDVSAHASSDVSREVDSADKKSVSTEVHDA